MAMAIFAFSQQVPRDKVIQEIGTGTWCTYCPGAAMGADDLIANGCEVAVIEYHNGDAFTNNYSNARNTYYNVTGFPTAHFDGVLEYVGGSHTVSMYPNYLPLYQQRIVIPSDFTIAINGENTGNTYNVVLSVAKVNGSHGNLKVHLVLTESDIVYSWQGQTELNFVERTMVPNENGTTVDFSTNTEVQLELSFTLESGWVANNCELVAFVQNDATKECLQGTKVALSDLQPFQATAGFACNSNTPCVNSSVEFEDESAGDIISWNWTFEGGNPATSTVQNPVVTYNTVGDFDVQQIVYDGTYYDTLYSTNYINVITAPVAPNTPWGETVVCQGTSSVTYYTHLVPWGLTYIWSVDPPAAGTISGPDTNATFTPAANYIGNFEVKVKAINNCGDGAWSSGLLCGSYDTPNQFTLSDGAGYCEGSQGVELTLDGSESGVNYELFLDGDPTGIIQPGTGSSLSFGYQTETGIYTCQAYTDYCNSWMVGNSYIFMTNIPATAATPTGSTSECNSHTAVEYETSGAASATSYSWFLTPSAAGTITGTGVTANVDWADNFTGIVQITVQGVNTCGSGPVSDDLQVTVSQSPAPEVSGDPDVCDYDQGVIYSTADQSGDSYEWTVTGGTISSGAGTHEIQVNWGAAGTGYVSVVETNAEGCDTQSESFAVVIDDCTGIGENAAGTLKLFPNPAKDRLSIVFSVAGQFNASVSIFNSFGQLMSVAPVKSSNGTFQAQVALENMPAGIYTVQVRMDDGTMLQRKFVKSE